MSVGLGAKSNSARSRSSPFMSLVCARVVKKLMRPVGSRTSGGPRDARGIARARAGPSPRTERGGGCPSLGGSARRGSVRRTRATRFVAPGSPTRIRFARHSSFTDRTQRSAYAFRFGLRGGNRTGLTPPSRTASSNAGQYLPSRSCIRDRWLARPPTSAHREVPRDLGHPAFVREGGYSRDLDPTRRHMDDKQDVIRHQAARRPHLGREEIRRRQYLASPGRHDRDAVWPRWRAIGDRGASSAQAAADRLAPFSPAGAAPDSE